MTCEQVDNDIRDLHVYNIMMNELEVTLILILMAVTADQLTYLLPPTTPKWRHIIHITYYSVALVTKCPVLVASVWEFFVST